MSKKEEQTQDLEVVPTKDIIGELEILKQKIINSSLILSHNKPTDNDEEVVKSTEVEDAK